METAPSIGHPDFICQRGAGKLGPWEMLLGAQGAERMVMKTPKGSWVVVL